MLTLFIRRIIPFLLLIPVTLPFQSCQDNNASQQNSTAENPAPDYPSIPDSTMQRLWNECDYIDFVFYNLAFSMSQEKQNDIRSTLQHISRQTADIQPECQAMGRLFFQIDGENAAQADFFFTNDCQYFIFYENDQKTYANAMTPAGIQFYERVLNMMEGR